MPCYRCICAASICQRLYAGADAVDSEAAALPRFTAVANKLLDSMHGQGGSKQNQPAVKKIRTLILTLTITITLSRIKISG